MEAPGALPCAQTPACLLLGYCANRAIGCPARSDSRVCHRAEQLVAGVGLRKSSGDSQPPSLWKMAVRG